MTTTTFWVSFSEMLTSSSKQRRRECSSITRSRSRKPVGIQAELTRQLLAFSRKQILFPVTLDLNAVVRDVGKILQRLIGEDVQIVTDLETSLDSTRADRGQIEQILMNLATNARDAMPNGGKFTIRTGNAELGPDDVALHPLRQAWAVRSPLGP